MCNDEIFTITLLQKDGNGDPEKWPDFGDKRVVGFFHCFAEAKTALMLNECDMNEAGYYPFAIVEEIRPGIYPIASTARHWFAYDSSKDSYIETKSPKSLEHVYGLSIG